MLVVIEIVGSSSVGFAAIIMIAFIMSKVNSFPVTENLENTVQKKAYFTINNLVLFFLYNVNLEITFCVAVIESHTRNITNVSCTIDVYT